jgi:hypothetical protein
MRNRRTTNLPLTVGAQIAWGGLEFIPVTCSQAVVREDLRPNLLRLNRREWRRRQHVKCSRRVERGGRLGHLCNVRQGEEEVSSRAGGARPGLEAWGDGPASCFRHFESEAMPSRVRSSEGGHGSSHNIEQKLRGYCSC